MASIRLDSYHHEGSQRIDHHLGTLSGDAPKRRFLFRYRDMHGTETELTLDEGPDGDFEAVYTYPPNKDARDTGIGAVDGPIEDEWTIEVTYAYQGTHGGMTIHAIKKVPRLS
jgi:hypothetical protein